MRFWTSDHHFGHVNMTKAGKDLCGRPFGDPHHMNREFVRLWNERVGDGDVVNYLGDACMGKINESLSLIGALKGTKYLFPGNHDRCHPTYSNKSKLAEWEDRYRDVGFILPPDGMLMRSTTLGPYRVLMCHFPISPDLHYEFVDGKDKFERWRPVDDGTWDYLIHGHVHDDWKIQGREINVGVDVWDYAPVSDDELLQLIKDSKT